MSSKACCEPAHDHHLVRLASDRPRRSPMRRDLLPGRPVSHRIAVFQDPRPLVQRSPVPADQSRPDAERKAIHRWLADAKRSPPREPGIPFLWEEKIGLARYRPPDAVRLHVRHARAVRAVGPARNVFRDECPGADPAFEISLGDELLERIEDRKTRDPQLGRERSGRRDALARPQPSLENRVAKTLVELPVEGRRRRSIDGDDGDQRGSVVFTAPMVMAMGIRTQMAIATDLSAVQR